MKIPLSAAAVLAAALVLASGAAAQDGPTAAQQALAEATPEQVGARAAALMSSLEELVAASRGYRERLATASAEDSLVLRLQLTAVYDRFMTGLDELAREVAAASGDRREDLRVRSALVFREVTPVVWRLIDELGAEVDGLRARRPSTAPGDRAALEAQIALRSRRLDRFYQYGRDLVGNLETVGEGADDARTALVQRLLARADALSGRLQLDVLRIGELKRRLKDAPDDADARQVLLAVRKSLENNTASQTVTLDLLDGLGQPVAALRAELVATTQDLASGLLDVRTTATLLNRGWHEARDWLKSRGPGVLGRLLLVAAILLVGRALSRLVRRVVARSVGSPRLQWSRLLQRTVTDWSQYLVLILAAVFALSQLGVSLGPMLAGLGVVGFILGFAMQDSLSNLAAGMMILVNRPYDVGDLVEVSGVFGRVEHMSMVSTSVLTLDNQKLVVPNSRIWGDVIKNVTDQRIRRVDLVFGISYGDDIPKAERVLREILAAHDLVLEDPEPVVRLHALGDSSVNFIVRPWVRKDDYWEVHWDVTRAVKMRFDEEGITIPFPQRDVHIYQTRPARHSGGALDTFDSPVTPAHDPDPVAGDQG